ncbi:hypothetical protein MKEN_00244200 [Mycena kentingensis (nom. inval.)]|nr:hypothetical protein MKEN_00244200 [Mycena kentingensis (nom. inval.)]
MSGKAPPRGPRALLAERGLPTGPRSLLPARPPPPPDDPPPPPPPTESIAGPSSRPAVAFALKSSSLAGNESAPAPDNPTSSTHKDTSAATSTPNRSTTLPLPPPVEEPPPPPPPDDAPPPLPPEPVHKPFTIHTNLKRPEVKNTSVFHPLPQRPAMLANNTKSTQPPPPPPPPAEPVPPPRSKAPSPSPPPSPSRHSLPSPPPTSQVFSEPPPPRSPPPTTPKYIPKPLPIQLPPTPSTSKLPLLPTQPPPSQPIASSSKPTPTELKPSSKAQPVSLPPLPSWPPPPSALPTIRSFRVLFDPAVDGVPSTSSRHTRDSKESPDYWRRMIEHVRARCTPEEATERIRGKGKGRESLYRLEGQVVGKGKARMVNGTGEVNGIAEDDDEMCEEEPVPYDPRRVPGFRPLTAMRPPKDAFTVVSYEYDANTPTPPPTTVLLAGFPPLTPNKTLQAHLSQYGSIEHFGRQMDTATGATLGVACVRFGKAEEAKKCVEKEDGLPSGSGLNVNGMATGGDQRRAVLDPDGLILKAYLRELDERRKRERREKELAEKATADKAQSTPVQTNAPLAATPLHGQPQPPQPTAAALKPIHPSLPKNPMLNGASPAQHQRNGIAGPSNGPHSQPPQSMAPYRSNRFTARPMNSANYRPPKRSPSPQLDERARARLPPASSTYYGRDRDRNRDRSRDRDSWDWRRGRNTDVYLGEGASQRDRDYERDRQRERDRERDRERERANREREREREREEREKEKERVKADVKAQLATNGMEHVRLKLPSINSISESQVSDWAHAFKDEIQKILRDHEFYYITFQLPKTARRVERVLSHAAIGFHTVTLTVHAAPAAEQGLDEAGLVGKAQEMVEKELRTLLEKDVNDRIVGVELRSIVAQWKTERTGVGVAGGKDGDAAAPKVMDLKSLSFKKANKTRKEVVETVEQPEEPEEDAVVLERPKKKRKKEKDAPTKKAPPPKKIVARIVSDDDNENMVESEDDDEAADGARKRPLADEELEEGEEAPVRKRIKLQLGDPEDDEGAVVEKAPLVGQKNKKAKKEKEKKVVAEKKTKRKPSVDDIVVPEDLDSFEPPAIADFRPSPDRETSTFPSRSTSPVSSIAPPRTPTPLPDPFDIGLCEDDEDLYFAKLVLSGSEPEPTLDLIPPSSLPETSVPFRRHLTGSARTEGFYKISHAEKVEYVSQYQARGANNTAETSKIVVDEPPPQHVESSRSNRANARRRAQGLEEINQVQRAVALSKGETAAANELTFKFNQLQTRKKHLRFARSPIHDWGLYAMEKISRGEMVIEYVGEIIRAQVAEKREKAYERQGIGSSYLFRIDEDLVVDATKKGNLGRLINHSCDPNCTAKIITINGEKKIVIYAKQEIELGDEITYDYHFPFEQDKIPCLCGSAKCRGFLN